MTIYVLVRELQADTPEVLGAYTDRELAEREQRAFEDGELVEGREEEWPEDAEGDDWTVTIRLEETTLYRPAQTSVESQTYIDTGNAPAVKGVR